jgi:hypothetical protein
MDAKKRGGFMNLSMMMKNAVQYISEAVARIFGPTDDEYPPTGVQPFEGEPPKPSRPAD